MQKNKRKKTRLKPRPKNDAVQTLLWSDGHQRDTVAFIAAAAAIAGGGAFSWYSVSRPRPLSAEQVAEV
jgi:hypothetical protein